MHNMTQESIKTTEQDIKYLGLDFKLYKTSFVRKDFAKALTIATEWMKKYSDTFIKFDDYEGYFVARHEESDHSTHLNDRCSIASTLSGKSWAVDLSIRR